MSQIGNSAERQGGEFMIQDRDHMPENQQQSNQANRPRQSEQSHDKTSQHGAGKRGEKGPRQSH